MQKLGLDTFKTQWAGFLYQNQKLAAVDVEGHIPAAMVDSQVLSIASFSKTSCFSFSLVLLERSV